MYRLHVKGEKVQHNRLFRVQLDQLQLRVMRFVACRGWVIPVRWRWSATMTQYLLN